MPFIGLIGIYPLYEPYSSDRYKVFDIVCLRIIFFNDVSNKAEIVLNKDVASEDISILPLRKIFFSSSCESGLGNDPPGESLSISSALPTSMASDIPSIESPQAIVFHHCMYKSYKYCAHFPKNIDKSVKRDILNARVFVHDVH